MEGETELIHSVYFISISSEDWDSRKLISILLLYSVVCSRHPFFVGESAYGALDELAGYTTRTILTIGVGSSGVLQLNPFQCGGFQYVGYFNSLGKTWAAPCYWLRCKFDSRNSTLLSNACWKIDTLSRAHKAGNWKSGTSTPIMWYNQMPSHNFHCGMVFQSHQNKVILGMVYGIGIIADDLRFIFYQGFSSGRVASRTLPHI